MVVRLGAQFVSAMRSGPASSRAGSAIPRQLLLDVAVAVAVTPVAQVAVAQLIAEQGDDAVLGLAFGLADRDSCTFSFSSLAFTIAFGREPVLLPAAFVFV